MENLGSFGRKITKNVVEYVIKFNDLQKTNFVWCYMNSAFQTNKTSSKVRTDGTVEWTWRMTLYLLCSKSRVSLLLFIFGGKCNYFRYVICLSKSEYDRVKTENQKKTCHGFAFIYHFAFYERPNFLESLFSIVLKMFNVGFDTPK